MDAECLFVLDFAVLKQVIKPMVEAVDHKVILPTQNEKLGLREEHDAVIVDYFGKGRFVFPKSDVALVPVKNTTVEMLAEYFAMEVRKALLAGRAHPPDPARHRGGGEPRPVGGLQRAIRREGVTHGRA